MTPLCPFCHHETQPIGKNLASESWGCEPCWVYINRAIDQPKKPEPVPASQIRVKP